MYCSSDPESRHELPTPLRYCPNAKLLLAMAFLGTFLLFVRCAVLWNPGYSYLGPTGADRVFYYAYVRSLVIDGDLDFTNDIALQPPSTGLIVRDGKPLNKYPIGSPLLSLPFYAFTHMVLLVGNRLGFTDVSLDGYSAPYAFSYALGQMLWALFGVWLMYRALLRYFEPQTAALAVVATWFSTHALHYAAVDLMMSHAAATFSIAWCSYEAVKLRESPGRWQTWFGLGASSALVVLVRYQNGVYLLVPGCAAILAAVPIFRKATAKRALALAGCGAVGFCLMFAPQLLVWRAIFGTFFTNSYQTEFTFHWLRPHLVEALFDPVAGLAIWLPALGLGLVGCFALAIYRKNVLAGAAGVAWLASLYVTSCWWAWQMIVHRSPFDMLFPVCLGFGFAISCFWRRRPLASLIIIGLLVLWNVPFALGSGASMTADGSPFTTWLDYLLILLRLKNG